MLGVNKYILTPKPVDDLLPADDIAIFFRQQDEQLHGNAFELQHSVIAPQFIMGAIKLKLTKLV